VLIGFTMPASPASPAEPAHEFVAARFQASMDAPARFFEANADRLSQACFEMARRFQRGGRLLVFGSGSSTTDAQHVSVEFVHPVIVGKRALPALALTNDVASVLGLARELGFDEIYAQQLHLLGRREDMALGLTAGGADAAVLRGLHTAKPMGMLTIWMCAAGVNAGGEREFGFRFEVSGELPRVVQEVQETAYHVLWETVHVFFEHKGLLEA
jgi:D-sedoheptulose 7-phosphate isomerase